MPKAVARLRDLGADAADADEAEGLAVQLVRFSSFLRNLPSFMETWPSISAAGNGDEEGEGQLGHRDAGGGRRC